MKPRVTLITLCVDDLERAVQFYRDGLGLPTEGIIGKKFEYGAVAFFDLQPGLKLAVSSQEPCPGCEYPGKRSKPYRPRDRPYRLIHSRS
jgi:catechol 2,3-dioxygenase-like lactoylglutathione lyase family enzyme